MTGVRVEPLYDGDPDAPDATPDIIGARLIFTSTIQGEAVITSEVDVTRAVGGTLWGKLGDVLQLAKEESPDG